MEKLKAASYSIYVNVFLTAAKLGVGILTGSIGIFAEFLHSFFDLVASAFAYVGIYKAQQPPDGTHPYGHEKFENLSSLLQTVLIFVTAVWVAYEAVMRLYHPAAIESSELGIAVMVVALIVDWYIAKFLHGVSEKEGSVALEADAYHFTSDLWSTTAVIIGLACANLGFPAGDSIGALIVAAMMVKLSFSLGNKALGVLLDKGATDDEVERIAAILGKEPDIKGYHKLRTRHMGSKLVVDMHILVDDKLSLSKAHAIAHKVEGRITQKVPGVKDVTIHVEPYEEEAGKKH
jgi:cation diffusion facilitator family transporter